MQVVVTGGAGYIGSHVVRCLARHGHDVVIYDDLSTGHRSLAGGFPLVVGGLDERDKLVSVLSGFDAVIHCAGYISVGESAEHPRKYLENNAVAGLVLLNACLDSGVSKFVFSSTAAVYGIPSRSPISEDVPTLPINPYGCSKLFLEQALEGYGSAYGLKFVALRYFNAAGADSSGTIGEIHNPETHLIPCALEVAAGARDELLIFGQDYFTADGTCIRDYVHVTDLAEAHVKALEYLAKGGKSTAMNLGTGKGYSVKEVVAAVEAVTGRKVRTRLVPPRAGDAPVLVADPSRAQQLLQWTAKHSLTDMVASAWMWQKQKERVLAGLIPARG
ncbi:MAG TPA: UDP-glucose 4-epimerase GalE [Terriglobia bacterium]|nr:UDP-glucose 4-epimerase GalE [Terriglobia bacterium]